ncbi:RT1 class I histocompatibility antigen, AA alpha chain isoform X3 [Anolis carolinensis]|uniref:RT1 class I histocompatibility antigen, AA alpha chain isoform X3 n=1 Tax=Anolis carolinensis TaxID=28377 RepID=UPI002F2B17BF
MALLLLLRVVALLLGHPGIAPLNPAPGVSSHSLKYFYTAISEDNELLSSFYVVGYMDDQRISQYDSTVRLELPCVSWMKKVEEVDPSYWKDETEVSRNSEQFFKENLVIARNRYNQSRGFHTLQQMYGCDLRKDGSKGGYRQYAYDGKDFISFDKETLTWTAADGAAQKTKRKWDAQSMRNQYLKAYLQETCIEWLKKYLDYGKETLLRTASKLGLILGCAMGILLLSTGIAVYFIKWQHDRRITSRCQYGCQAASTSDQKPNISKKVRDQKSNISKEGLERPQILVTTGNQIPADIKGPLYWGLKGSAQLPPGTWRLI